MKLFPLICAVWLIAFCPSWASDQDDHFLELKTENETVIFDLNTLQTILPGRIAVAGTTIDNPDVMKFKLKVLGTLQTFCARPDGQYPAPTDVLTLGTPDMPIKGIEVKSGSAKKYILWPYPYERLASYGRDGVLHEEDGYLFCKEELDRRAGITNGIRTKYLFDCRRGLMGLFRNDNDDPATVMTFTVWPGTRGGSKYRDVCYRVMHEMPYEPE